MSAIESNCAPNSLCVLVQRATRPSMPSSTMATKMAMALVSKVQFGACPNIAQDAPRDQAGHLHASDIHTVARTQPQRVALVLQRGLVERRVQEGAGKVPALLHRAVDRRAVRMHVEDVHEDAHL